MPAPRTLRLSSPLLKGGDVSGWQRTLNAQLRRWGVKTSPVEVDGEYGPATKKWTETVCYGLGIAQNDLRHGVTPQIRRKVRSRTLTVDERRRYNARKDWRSRLKKRLNARGGGGAELAIRYARKYVGVKESPANSNRGPIIDLWQRAVGMIAQPWCGAFVAACYRAAGLHPGNNIRYTPALVADAKAGRDIWEKWIPLGHGEPRPGDAVLFNFPGGQFVDHVGLYVGDGVTIEGNTSGGPGGSQANGGGVFVRRRGTANVVGYARPKWGK